MLTCTNVAKCQYMRRASAKEIFLRVANLRISLLQRVRGRLRSFSLSRSKQTSSSISIRFCQKTTQNRLFFQIKQGVHNALRSILEKRVVQSLSPILDNPKLDPELRALIRNNLQEFCSAAPVEGDDVFSTRPRDWRAADSRFLFVVSMANRLLQSSHLTVGASLVLQFSDNNASPSLSAASLSLSNFAWHVRFEYLDRIAKH